jgi:hypothetical protein
MHPPLFFSSNLNGLGLVTRAMVHQRTHELAMLAGRVPPDVAQADYEQAKRDITGETDQERQDAMLDVI